jgi:SAM-dependent methyltransferase
MSANESIDDHPMAFTGERYVPEQRGQLQYEHLHRYVLSLELAKGKTVLDVACGEGYGTALLATGALSVIGVDVDPQCVEHAQRKYAMHQNLGFLVGRCDALPLKDHSVGLVTSFETIEHHDKHQEMLHEIKRVLCPDGVLVISSPNREAYSDQPQSRNPYHVKELSWGELNDLLTQHFRFIEFYGQRLATGSFVYPLHDARGGDHYRGYTSQGEAAVQHVPTLKSPVYFLAICSNEAKAVDPSDLSSIYIDQEVDLFEEYVQVSKWANGLHKELSEITASFAWQQVCRLRRLRDRLFPVGTERHRLYIRCLRQARGLSLDKSISRKHPAWIQFARSLFRFDLLGKVFRVLETQGIDGLIHRARRRLVRAWEPYRRKYRYRRTYLVETSWEPLSFDAGTTPYVSIVIPVYNKHLYTFSCLKSILNSQPERSYEVIVADDCSTDDTAIMLQAMQGIRVVRA